MDAIKTPAVINSGAVGHDAASEQNAHVLKKLEEVLYRMERIERMVEQIHLQIHH